MLELFVYFLFSEKVIVKVVDSATELRLQEVEQELLEAKVKYRTRRFR